MRIALATINARHAHSSLALRCLKANLGELEPEAQLHEFVTGARIETMAEVLLASNPVLIGLSVYIWNVDELTRLAALLRTIAPQVVIVLGGPEISFETAQQDIFRHCDYVITGAGEHAFARLARRVLAGGREPMKIITGDSLLTEGIELPYRLYSDDDIAHRYIYVEASRGCPFKCEFCLSSLDRTAVAFDQTLLLDALDHLYQRGARHFKFVDRTFNLRIDDSIRLLEFFLVRAQHDAKHSLLLHFELIPDNLPDRLRALLVQFPAGCLQFEIGIQSWNPLVQANISRRQNNQKAEENLRWLREQTAAHLHVDLIAGLPGESLNSFAAGFDRLIALRPHEIQVGVLKRLRGTPITRHTETFGLRFNPAPPYNLLASNDLSFPQTQMIQRFARYWDLIGNSGHFSASLPWLLGGPNNPNESAFENFNRFAQWLYSVSDSTHRFSADRLYRLVAQWLRQQIPNPEQALSALGEDRNKRLAARPDKTAVRDNEPFSVTNGSQLRHRRALPSVTASSARGINSGSVSGLQGVSDKSASGAIDSRIDQAARSS